MKKILLTIIFLILFIIFPQQVSANKPKVAIIGSSSFSHGCKDLPYRKGFVIQLREAYPDKNFECFAKGGQTTKYFKNQFNDNVKGKGFSELIIYAGLNGLAKELKPSQDDLIEIFRDAEKENITVIVISAQPFGKYQHWNQRWGDNIIKNHEWLKGKPEGIDYFVDIYSIIKDSADEYKMNPFYAMTDGLHMNQEGHNLMFEKISEIYETGSITNLNNTSNNTATPVSLTVNEIDRMVAQPTLQIRIPGLNFTGGLKITKKDGKTFIQTDFFQQYLVAVYKYSVIAISILAVFMIIVAGIQWMISGGSPDKIKAAQKRIGQSIIGLLIAVGSYTILYTINPYLVGFKALETQYFNLESTVTYAEGEDSISGKTVNEQCLMEKFHLEIGKKPELETVEMFNLFKVQVNKYSASAWEKVSDEILASDDPEIKGILHYMKDFKNKEVPDLAGIQDGAGLVSQKIGNGVGYSRKNGEPLKKITYDMHVNGLAVDFMTRSNWDFKTPLSKSKKGDTIEKWCPIYKRGLENLKKLKPDDPYKMYDRLDKKLESCFNNFNNGTDPWSIWPDEWIKIFERNNFRWGGWGWSAPPKVHRTDGMHFEYLGECENVDNKKYPSKTTQHPNHQHPNHQHIDHAV